MDNLLGNALMELWNSGELQPKQDAAPFVSGPDGQRAYREGLAKQRVWEAAERQAYTQQSPPCTADRSGLYTAYPVAEAPGFDYYDEDLVNKPCGCTETALERRVIAAHKTRKEAEARAQQEAQTAIKYAEYKPEFDPDLHPDLDRTPVAVPVPVMAAVSSTPTLSPRKGKNFVPAVREPDAEPDLPLPTTSEEFAEWRRKRYVWSAGAPVSNPDTRSFVPVSAEETEQVLTVGANGFAWVDKFAHLEIERR